MAYSPYRTARNESELNSEVITPAQRSKLPTFVSGERISSRTDLETVVEGIMRHLAQNPHREAIVQDLRKNIHAIPAWMYSAVERLVSAGLVSTPKALEEHETGVHLNPPLDRG